MTTKSKAKAIIISSFIMYLMDMDSSKRTKAHTKKLRKELLEVTRSKGTIKLAELSNRAWTELIHEYKNDNLNISLALTIEALAFSFEEDLTNMYGDYIIDYIADYSMKEQVGDISKYAKDSYIAADALRDKLRDIIFKEEM